MKSPTNKKQVIRAARMGDKKAVTKGLMDHIKHNKKFGDKGGNGKKFGDKGGFKGKDNYKGKDSKGKDSDKKGEDKFKGGYRKGVVIKQVFPGKGKTERPTYNNKPSNNKGDKYNTVKKDDKYNKGSKLNSIASYQKKDNKSDDNNNKRQDKPKRKFESSGNSNNNNKNKNAGGNAPNYKSMKSNFELVESLKNNWNKVRIKATSNETRELLLEQMVAQMTGHVLQVTLRHDASRIVQSIIQFGNTEQKQGILSELCVKMVEIAKTPYGHFSVLKAIATMTSVADQTQMCKAMSGHFVMLGTNVIGARTCEMMLANFPAKLSKDLKAEFYGRKYTVLLSNGPPKNLRALIEGLPSKENAIMDHMRDLVQKMTDKGLLTFSYVHTLVWEYAKEVWRVVTTTEKYIPKEGDKEGAGRTRMDDLINMVIDSVSKFMSSKNGAKVVCLLNSFSGARDRKKLMKAMKGSAITSLCSDSHLAVMSIVDVTDDTINIQKSILEEIRSIKPVVTYSPTGEIISSSLLPPLLQIAKHQFGRKILLRLLSPSKRHLEPDEEELFNLPNLSSKKPAESRRKEHVQYLKTSLIKMSCLFTEDLLRCRWGAKVFEEIISTFYPTEVLSATASIFAGIEVVANDEDMEEDETDEYAEGEYDEEEGVEDEDEYDEDGKYDENGEYIGNDNDEYDEEYNEEEDLEGLQQAEEENEEDEEDEELIQQEKKSANVVKVVESAPLLAIYEDPIAQTLLKKILLIQKSSENKKLNKSVDGDVVIDSSLWDEDEDETSSDNIGFALTLLNLLEEKDLISTWIMCNRACFTLVEMSKIPSATSKVIQLISNKDIKSQLEANSDESKGAKLLLDLIEVKTTKKAPASSKKAPVSSKKTAKSESNLNMKTPVKSNGLDSVKRGTRSTKKSTSPFGQL
jgi:pumilio family protein 6